MKYEIKDDNFPVVICHLNKGEKMISTNQIMVSMDSSIKPKSSLNFFKSMFPVKIFFKNIVALNDGKITFTDGFPGNILPLNVESGKKYVILKSAFLASEESILTSTFLVKKTYTNTFNDDSLIKVSGQGICFLKINGHMTSYHLLPGQQMIINYDDLVMMDASCKIKLQPILKWTVRHTTTKIIVIGPGHLVTRTIPLAGNWTLSSLDRRNIQ